MTQIKFYATAQQLFWWEYQKNSSLTTLDQFVKQVPVVNHIEKPG